MTLRQGSLIGAFLFFVSFSFVVPASVLAVAGDFDTTFSGPDGVLQYSCPLGTDTVLQDIVRQPDGKIIATGTTIVSGYPRMLLVRFNADGTVDNSLGGLGGFVLAAGDGEGYGIALQPDGKILVTGKKNIGGNSNIALWRYNSNGTPDAGFGANGLVVVDSGSNGWASGARIAVQTDGKIVVAGTYTYSTITIAAIIRYNSDGNFDSSFGTGGINVYGTYGDGTHSYSFSDIAIQPDGKLVLCGTVSTVSDSYLFVMRYNSNGTLDSGFGSSGVVTYPGPGNNAAAMAIAIQPDDKLIVGGTINGANGGLLLRLNSNGSLDSGFGTAGAVFITGNGAADLSDIAIQANGKIVVAGKAHQAVILDAFAVWRFDSNGSIDPAFGTGGFVAYNYTNLNVFEGAHAVLIQPDGKIVVAGDVAYESGSTGGMMRLLPNYISITKNISGSGTVDCSPDPVPEGGLVSCLLTPTTGNYLSTLRVGPDFMSMMFWDPVWSFTERAYWSALIVEPLFAPATIGLYQKGGIQGNELWKKTDNKFVDAFADTAASDYDLIRVLSGVYFDLAGITCSDRGLVIPTLAGGWTDLNTRGTTPTVLAPVFRISGGCSLIVDGITIQ